LSGSAQAAELYVIGAAANQIIYIVSNIHLAGGAFASIHRDHFKLHPRATILNPSLVHDAMNVRRKI